MWPVLWFIYLFIYFNGQAYFLQGNFVQLVNSVSSSHAAASATKLVLQGSPRKPSSMGFQSLQLNSNVTVTQQSACICSSDSAVVQQPHSYQLQLLCWVLAAQPLCELWDLQAACVFLTSGFLFDLWAVNLAMSFVEVGKMVDFLESAAMLSLCFQVWGEQRFVWRENLSQKTENQSWRSLVCPGCPRWTSVANCA